MVAKCRRFKTCVLVLWMCLSYGLFHMWSPEDGEDSSKSTKFTYEDFRFLLLKATKIPLTSTLSYNGKNNQLNLTTNNETKRIEKKEFVKDAESFIQGLAPNVPYEFWMTREKSKNSSSKYKHTCAYFPSVLDLQFNNKYVN